MEETHLGTPQQEEAIKEAFARGCRVGKRLAPPEDYGLWDTGVPNRDAVDIAVEAGVEDPDTLASLYVREKRRLVWKESMRSNQKSRSRSTRSGTRQAEEVQ